MFYVCNVLVGNGMQSLNWMRPFAYSWKLPAYSGAFLLTLFDLQLELFLLTALAFLLTVGAFLLTVRKGV